MSDRKTRLNRRVTLREIAHHANVSVSTASRALNNDPNVNEATRLDVQRAVAELNYSLDHLRSVRQSRKSVTLLARGDFAPTTSEFSSGADFEKLAIRGIRACLETANVDLSIRHLLMRAEDAAPFVESFSGDGVLVLTGMVAPEFVRALQDNEVPFVIAGSHVLPLEANCVMADNVRGVEMAVHHLAAQGCRKIGLVNSSTMTKTSEDKMRGLLLGIQQHGLAYSPSQVVSSRDFDLESGYTQTLLLVANVPDVDAIIYGHDVMAMGGLRALKERGLRIPQDVAVVGYHDYEIAQFTDPPLTTIRFDTELMGWMAARRLLMMLDDPDGRHWLLTIPTELVVRESTRRKA